MRLFILNYKYLAGIARACFNADACILDNGITTGLEKYAMRRGNNLTFLNLF